jgi:hypothetical protein
MLGFGDIWVLGAYVLCIASTALCVIYGLMYWNEEEELPPPVHPEDEDLEFEETI